MKTLSFFFFLCFSSLALALAQDLSLLQHWKQMPIMIRFQAETATAAPGQSTSPPLTGQLWVSHHLFRLEIHGEFEQTMVNDGQVVWLWDHALNQVTKTSLIQLPQDSPFLILTHSVDTLTRLFAITATASDKHHVCYHFVPRQGETAFCSCDLVFFDGFPVIFRIQKEQQTPSLVLHIYPISTQKFSPDRFRFVVPPGVDVLDTDTEETPNV